MRDDSGVQAGHGDHLCLGGHERSGGRGRCEQGRGLSWLQRGHRQRLERKLVLGGFVLDGDVLGDKGGSSGGVGGGGRGRRQGRALRGCYSLLQLRFGGLRHSG